MKPPRVGAAGVAPVVVVVAAVVVAVVSAGLGALPRVNPVREGAAPVVVAAGVAPAVVVEPGHENPPAAGLGVFAPDPAAPVAGVSPGFGQLNAAGPAGAVGVAAALPAAGALGFGPKLKPPGAAAGAAPRVNPPAAGVVGFGAKLKKLGVVVAAAPVAAGVAEAPGLGPKLNAPGAAGAALDKKMRLEIAIAKRNGFLTGGIC